MNSVHLFVRDAVGVHYLDTFTDNTPENIAAFRKHVASCKRFWRSRIYEPDHRGAPCHPVEIVIEPYYDASQGA
jgi:hypothetical protein